MKSTILVIDDNLSMLSVTREVLQMCGHFVLTAQSGEEALQLLDENDNPDLILLDFKLRDMDGSEFLIKLEEDRPDIIHGVPVVFYSGKDEIPLGRAVGCIRKVISINEFLLTVEKFLNIFKKEPFHCEERLQLASI